MADEFTPENIIKGEGHMQMSYTTEPFNYEQDGIIVQVTNVTVNIGEYSNIVFTGFAYKNDGEIGKRRRGLSWPFGHNEDEDEKIPETPSRFIIRAGKDLNLTV